MWNTSTPYILVPHQNWAVADTNNFQPSATGSGNQVYKLVAAYWNNCQWLRLDSLLHWCSIVLCTLNRAIGCRDWWQLGVGSHVVRSGSLGRGRFSKGWYHTCILGQAVVWMTCWQGWHRYYKFFPWISTLFLLQSLIHMGVVVYLQHWIVLFDC